jgi:hypothetical protein
VDKTLTTTKERQYIPKSGYDIDSDKVQLVDIRGKEMMNEPGTRISACPMT